MPFAKVVVGLPVDGPFDYAIPKALEKHVKTGMRVRIDFNGRKETGYIVARTSTSAVAKTKPIVGCIDDAALLSKAMLALTREFAEYYGCSWGEAIDTALPEAVRQSRVRLAVTHKEDGANGLPGYSVLLVHDPFRQQRADVYDAEIEKALGNKKSVLYLTPSLAEAAQAKKRLEQKFKCRIILMTRRSGVRQAIDDWLAIRNGSVDLVLGVRSAVFAPLPNLGLIIIDEEESQNYKNDQTPHYSSRDIALMRAAVEKTRVVLGAVAPSLEMMQLVRLRADQYVGVHTSDDCKVQIVDMKIERSAYMKHDIIFSQVLQSALNHSLTAKEKVLLLVNRKGFATYAYCKECNFIERCPRCSANLTYHFKNNELVCHHCNHKTEPPMLCPRCNASYIRYAGSGIEKIESELHRLWPNVTIVKAETLADLEQKEAQVYIATQLALHSGYKKFGLVALIAADQGLNRPDFRATEKTYALLVAARSLAAKTLLIQTNNPAHYCFQALKTNDATLFYDEELRQRKQLDFPPYKHFLIVKVRSRQQDKAEGCARLLYDMIAKTTDHGVTALSVNPAQPSKLRDNYYWQILIKTKDPRRAASSIKKHIKKIGHSAVTITMDVDPL